MLVAERHREIVNVLDQEGSVRVTELARLFQVTEETIRRDLERLEAEGRLVRTHGGAVGIRHYEREAPFSEREISYMQEKIAIAREAVQRVVEGDTILLDASTTAWQMARLLPDMRLTVLTNAIKVAVELADRTRIRVISTGGTLSPASLSFVGPAAERMLKEYHVNKLFFSCKGIDVELGLRESSESNAMIKRRMMSISDHRYLLADHSKFGTRALEMLAPLKEVEEIITDSKIDTALLQQLKSRDFSVKLV
ncbi:DeoR/GlpR family DNA-binding transcription regulator [Paenibacillus allorhizosphaerae]|uniref:HTH-type transcriptional regulator YdjF n=1 Tax=Paenibacillus allorhizosphaerae TaxID=2849866 RepID=A0ABM8VB45_9BACL|nr:DeoR/GlpR family DNA-binding transcription regulator [Paenibacillus allorhizosphaerae]CAG7617611.1 putative HTH-type transcriptional regulator YdjF [Paenibacillus allorhizosphaerae]